MAHQPVALDCDASDAVVGVDAVAGRRAVTVASNQLSDNGEAGIIMQAGTSGNVLRYNQAFGNVTFDCQDDTVGGQRAGVANAWATSNRGVTSSPAGLCRP